MHEKKALFFLYSSAGELDWTAPIIDRLLKKDFNIEIIYLSKGVKKSIEDNTFLSDYLTSHKKIKQTTLGWFARRARRRGFLLYQNQSKFRNSKLATYLFKRIDTILNFIYISDLSKHIKLKHTKDRYIVFLEFRNLDCSSNLRAWHENSFTNSTFFYFPHAPGVYMNMSNTNYPENNTISKSRSYVTLGHPSDLEEISKDYNLLGVEPIYIGHPKYSNEWLSPLKKSTPISNLNHTDKVVKILVISRGVDSHLTSEIQRSLIDSTLRVVSEEFLNYQLLIKKHPRGNDFYWDDIAQQNPSITFTKDHILNITNQVDFAIAFWSSASMDCFLMNTPVIDFIDPKKSPDTRFGSNGSSTVFRELGVAIPANNEVELKEAIRQITSLEYQASLNSASPFFQNIIHRTNQWETYFEQALKANNMPY